MLAKSCQKSSYHRQKKLHTAATPRVRGPTLIWRKEPQVPTRNDTPENSASDNLTKQVPIRICTSSFSSAFNENDGIQAAQ